MSLCYVVFLSMIKLNAVMLSAVMLCVMGLRDYIAPHDSTKATASPLVLQVPSSALLICAIKI